MARARRSRWWLYGLLIAGACVSLPLGLLGPQNSVPVSLATHSSGTQSPLQMRTIVAYSLQRQLHEQQRTPVHCEPQPARPNLHSHHMWQTLGPDVHLYSAYYDHRLSPFNFIRIISMLRGSARPTLFCQVWYDGHVLIVEALRTEIWVSNWDKHAGEDVYYTVLLSCPLPTTFSESAGTPQGVSVVLHPCEHSEVFLKINVRSASRRNFAVCVKGMDFLDQDISLRLVEWIELNRLLGADHFFIYVYSVHSNVQTVLNYYHKKGQVTVVPITLPGRQPNEPHIRSRYLKKHLWQKRRNELVPYNDCLYRNIEMYKFVLPLDIDEVIVPVKNLSWRDMFDELLAEDPEILDKFSSFSVRNAYFFDSFPTSTEQGIPEFLHTMVHTTRSASFSPPGDSVKSFVVTSGALTVFNHYVLHPLSPTSSRNLVLDTGLAQMNHYKTECSLVTVADCRTKYLRYRKRDTLLLKFSQQLAARVTPVLRHLQLIK
ncbi:uncharacterized protein [Anabrus simplex]|uniref:uncharacterized protein n=1 Tax=Anabrus simplex TaxID=316456 RepID=UPI0035A26412